MAAGHVFGFLLAWAACLVICIFIAPVTAQMAGFNAGGWSWNLMLPMAGGFVTAAVGYPICYLVTISLSKRASAALALSIALVPVLAAIVGIYMGRTQ